MSDNSNKAPFQLESRDLSLEIIGRRKDDRRIKTNDMIRARPELAAVFDPSLERREGLYIGGIKRMYYIFRDWYEEVDRGHGYRIRLFDHIKVEDRKKEITNIFAARALSIDYDALKYLMKIHQALEFANQIYVVEQEMKEIDEFRERVYKL